MSLPGWLLDYCERLESKDDDLTNLNLNLRRLNDPMVQALAHSLRQNSKLRVLNLTSSLLKSQNAIELFSAGLSEHASLQVLHLSYNRLHDVTHLGRALPTNRSLTELCLDYNRIGPEGARELANGLCENKSLRVLRLNSNNVGDEGCEALARALKRNESLKTLVLSRNGIGPQGGESLEKALEKNKTLEILKLDENTISKAQESRLKLVCRANKNGRRYLSNEDFSVAIWPRLLERIKNDHALLYFFLREKPGLCLRDLSTRKRKLDDFRDEE